MWLHCCTHPWYHSSLWKEHILRFGGHIMCHRNALNSQQTDYLAQQYSRKNYTKEYKSISLIEIVTDIIFINLHTCQYGRL